MDDVAQVRSFNRTVSQRIGTLRDGYLARGRPLGASRVLWEIGDGATDLRTLRVRLDLDSGYLTRLVRSLQEEGLVDVAPDSADKRVRTVLLTAAGRAERKVLDRLSDALARSLLAPLSDSHRARLVEAMARVERLLTAGLVDVEVESPTSPAAQFCLESYFATLRERFEAGFEPATSIRADAVDLRPPAGLVLVAACMAVRSGAEH